MFNGALIPTLPSRSLKRALAAKRLIDVLAGCALLVTVAPIMLLAAIAIKFSSKGPVFYLGKRWGRGETQFTCLKLRTMRVDQDQLVAARGLSNVGSGDRLLIFEEDPRITKVGAFLRKCSIDELPQLLNVIRGDMSLIGPRPLVISMLENYPEIRSLRCAMRPGITGLWQVRNRSKNVSVLEMIGDDMEYLRTFHLGLDFEIALRTLPKILEPQMSKSENGDGK
jgi:lipopolysaccharide/colanic/teichoic acid biosynthesis glycosyltransferase